MLDVFGALRALKISLKPQMNAVKQRKHIVFSFIHSGRFPSLEDCFSTFRLRARLTTVKIDPIIWLETKMH